MASAAFHQWPTRLISAFHNCCCISQPFLSPRICCPFGHTLFYFFLTILVGLGRKQRLTYLLTTVLPSRMLIVFFPSVIQRMDGLRKSQFSCVTSYPQQRAHHMFSHCQEPSEKQIFSGFVLSPKINLTAWFTIMFMKVFWKWNASLWNQWTEINENSKGEADLYISSVVEHLRGGSAKHLSQWLCFSLR